MTPVSSTRLPHGQACLQGTRSTVLPQGETLQKEKQGRGATQLATEKMIDGSYLTLLFEN